MPKSAVIDTSVLVSAFLFRESVPGRVIELAERNVYTLYLSPILMEEVTRSLHHPRLKKAYGYADADVRVWCHTLKKIGAVWKEALPDIGSVCRDPDDDHVIACAHVVAASWIVTGDHDLLDLEGYKGVRIVSPRTFLEETAVL